MNEISHTADEGAFERCEGCGELVLCEMVFPLIQGKQEVVTCIACHVQHGRMYM